jgi:hypothetical protein
LTVIDDVTTWSLTHFEPVFAWSGAEELTVVEEQEGYGIVGRGRRQGGPADQSPNGNRSLRELTQPRVRGANRTARPQTSAKALPLAENTAG